MLGQRIDRDERRKRLGEIPVGLELVGVELGPIGDES